jgi:hypothetical protein
VTTCPTCNWENDAGAGTCAGCGAELGGGPPAVPRPRPPAEARPAPEEAPPEPGTPQPRTPGPVPISPGSRPSPRVVEVARGAPRPVDPARPPRAAPAVPDLPRRAPAPVRSIPVVVAPAGERPAVRRRSGSGVEDPVSPVDTAPPPVLPGPGSQLCPSCGSSVPANRRFCRCGARLPMASKTRSEPTIDAVAMRKSAFRRAQRLANGGRRPHYSVPLSWRTRFARAFAALVVLGAVGSQVPPWGDDVRSWLDTRVHEVVADIG